MGRRKAIATSFTLEENVIIWCKIQVIINRGVQIRLGGNHHFTPPPLDVYDNKSICLKLS